MSLSDFFPSLALLLPLMAAAYVYFAVTLSIIARKTATPDRWMAWIPILNIVLMCRIGRKPVWWIILLLIPFVNLIVAVILWMAIAQARGKSAALGILAVIPVLNMLLPLLLAMGPATAAGPGAPALPAVCPACGSPECVGEDFCGFTGQPIKAGITAAPPAAAAPAQPGFAAKAILAVILVLAVVYFGFGLISSAGKLLSGGGAPRAAAGGIPGQGGAGLSGPVAGTLTEFPIDTAPQPARPSSVTTKDMAASAQQAPLPGGVRVSAMTSAQYQARPSDKPVTVNVMNAEPSSALIARAMQSASGGDMTGINLRSARGGEYSGYRVRSPDTVTYVLDKADAPIVVMIHAPDASVKEVADRLAANIGNGNGLYDDPSFQASLQAMPEAPAGLTLVESGTYSGAALEGTMEDVKSDLGADFGAQAGGYLESVSKFIPPQLTTFRYEDTAHRRYQMAVGDYGGTLKSWTTWQLLRFTAGLGGLQTVPFAEGSALSGRNGSTEYLVFRRAGSLGIISAPAGQGATAVRLAESMRQ